MSPDDLPQWDPYEASIENFERAEEEARRERMKANSNFSDLLDTVRGTETAKVMLRLEAQANRRKELLEDIKDWLVHDDKARGLISPILVARIVKELEDDN